MISKNLSTLVKIQISITPPKFTFKVIVSGSLDFLNFFIPNTSVPQSSCSLERFSSDVERINGRTCSNIFSTFWNNTRSNVIRLSSLLRKSMRGDSRFIKLRLVCFGRLLCCGDMKASNSPCFSVAPLSREGLLVRICKMWLCQKK